MADEQNSTAAHAQLLQQWRSVVVATATTPGALELWLCDDRNELLDYYCRACLARACQAIKAGLASWADGTGDVAYTSVHINDAATTLVELGEVLGDSPLIALLRLGSDAIADVGYDVAATIANEEPF